MPLSKVHGRGLGFTDFLAKFTAAAKADLTAALTGCCKLCKCHFEEPSPSENAAKLLVGVLDINEEQFHRQASNLVVYQGWVTCDLKALLEMTDNGSSCGRTFDGTLVSMDQHSPFERSNQFLQSLQCGAEVGACR